MVLSILCYFQYDDDRLDTLAEHLLEEQMLGMIATALVLCRAGQAAARPLYRPSPATKWLRASTGPIWQGVQAMVTRWQTFVVVLCLPLCLHADIYRWDNGDVIPGTEGITPRPGIDLANWTTDSRSLRYADFSGGLDLHGAYLYSSSLDNARFTQANLSHAELFSSTLTNADLSRCNLTNARVFSSTLANANLAGAIVTGAQFGGTTYRGFSKEQLYSTASYQQSTTTMSKQTSPTPT
jgi:hypothetical protein